MGGPGSGLGAVPLPNNRQAWDVYGLDQIWEMLRDEDGIDSFRQVTAWYRMAHLCTDQADQLEKALGQLMVKWPPNPGSAAQAFKLQVEDLILSMRDSAAAAKANEGPLIRITSLISDAKDAILELKQQRTANTKAESEWIEQNQFRFAPILPSQFEPGWQDAIDRRARDIMFATDQAIGKAAADFRAPTPFALMGDPSETTASVNLGDQNSRPPRLVPTPVFDPPTPMLIENERIGPAAANGDSSDLTLDGDLLRTPGQEVLGGPNAGSFVNTPAGRVLAPGGVIGSGGNSTVERTNVVAGGAAADPGHGTTNIPGIMAPPIGRGMIGQGARGSATKSGGRKRRRSDPDDPWVAPEGGPSILESRPEPDFFDPGPNVIGIDR
jgi:hypothetical protein